MIRAALAFLLFSAWISAHGQESTTKADTTIVPPSDTTLVKKGTKVVTIETYAARYNPRKALLYSAVFPGAGQVYNKKYWKVPLVYGLIGGGVVYVVLNDNKHQEYREQLFSLLNEPSTVVVDKEGRTALGNLLQNGKLVNANSKLNVDQLRNVVNRFRRDRDFGLMMTGIIYFAQMIDAHVDAHLKEFDLNPQLKLSVEPSVQPTGLYGRSSGISLTLRF